MSNTNYSDKIAILVRFARTRGVRVDLFSLHLPEDVSGRINYLLRSIAINEPYAGDAFETLCHEIGHHLLYEKIGWIPQWLIVRPIRELIANYICIKIKRRMLCQ